MKYFLDMTLTNMDTDIMKLLNESAAILERKVVEYDKSGKAKKNKN